MGKAFKRMVSELLAFAMVLALVPEPALAVAAAGMVGDGGLEPQDGVVAKIGDEGYASLAEALAAVPKNDTETTVRMVADADIDVANAALTVENGQRVILDLYGKTVRAVCAAGTTEPAITVTGRFTVTDTSDGKAGILVGGADASWTRDTDASYEGAPASDLVRVDKRGYLVIKGCTLYNASRSEEACAVRHFANIFTIEAGTVDAARGPAVRAGGWDGNLQITNAAIGHYAGDGDCSRCGIQVDYVPSYSLSVVIYSGTISGERAVLLSGSDGSIRIYGGTFERPVELADMVDAGIEDGRFAATVSADGDGVITGGLFAEKPEARLLGQWGGRQIYPVANTDTETMDAYPWKAGAAVASVTTGEGDGAETHYYLTLDEAAEAAGEGVVTLLADVEDTYELAVGKTLRVAKGDYQLTVAAAEGGVLGESEEGGVTTYTCAQPVEVPAGRTLTYNGKEQAGVEPGDGYALTGDVATDAGTYVATATLAANCVWADGATEDRVIPWEIAPAAISGAAVAAVDDKPYTGSAIKPSPKVTFGGKTLKKGTDYTLSYKSNVNVGTATITVTGKGNYTGTKKVTFRIAFKDVSKSHQLYEKIHRANDLGIVNGYADADRGSFGPGDATTRGQIAVMLWNAARKPAAKSRAKTFPDVKSGAYYYEAVRWASSVGIANGYANGKFGPNDSITREQLAVMVANYARKVGGVSVSGSKADIAKLPDAGSVSGWAVTSVAWCHKRGILVLQSGKINPGKTADRATSAQMACDLYDLLH